MSDNLYLFANNNNGQAENNGSYRLYDMKIEGDSEGVESGVNYVDYLIGDGASYIDTGIYANPQYKYEIEFQDTTINSYENYFGSYKNLSLQRRLTYNNFELNYVGNLASSIGSFSTLKTVATIEKNKFYINNKLIYEFNTTDSTTAFQYTTYLFNRNPLDVYTNAKIYYFKMWNENNNLILYLRPCLDTQGIPCMYDEVSKTYFYNQGTGTFKYKKIIRDFQPVLDSNNVPCLLDKIKNKFYYNKSGEVFKTKEKPKYKKLKYLQGDGHNYLNLGNFTIDENTRFEGCFDKTAPSSLGTSVLLLSKLTLTTYSKVVEIKYAITNYMNLFINSYENALNITFSFGFNTCIFNDETISRAVEDTLESFESDVYLFKPPSWNSGLNGSQNIYYLKIYQSDELVFDGIPVLDQDNVPCMYDKVSDTFFYNQGTGTFSYGDRTEYTPIEYIESNGTQYIDTGVVPTANTDIDMTCRACDYSETPTLTNSYIMNGLQVNNNTYQYNDTDTTVQPNLVSSEGATLTMGSTNLALLDESDIETATNNGWSLV